MNPGRLPNSILAVLSNAGGAAAQWLMIVLIARYAGAVPLGQFALASAISGPIFMFGNMRLRFVQSADVNRRFAWRTFLSFRTATALLAGSVGIVLAMTLSADSDLAAIMFAVTAFKIAEAVQDICYGTLQARERMAIMAKSQLLTAAVVVAACWIALRSGCSTVAACWAVAAGRLALLLLVDLPAVVRTTALDGPPGERPDVATARSSATHAGDRWRDLLLLAWPLGVVALLDSAATNVPRYFLSAHGDVAAVGSFAAIAYFAFAGFLVVNSLGQSHAPRLARLATTGDQRAFYAVVRRLIIAAVVIGLLGIGFALVAGEGFLRAVYGDSLIGTGAAFPVIMAGGGCSYVVLVLVHALSAQGRFRYQIPLYAAGLSICGASAWLLVPQHGLTGAAWSTVAAGAVQASLAIWVVLRGAR